MQREKGYRCSGSGRGFPHGKHQREERIKRTQARLAGKVSAVGALGWEEKREAQAHADFVKYESGES